MMMMTEVADHKRPSHDDGFVLRDRSSGSLRGHTDSSGGKRPKTSRSDGGRGAAATSTTNNTKTGDQEKDRMGERVAQLQQLVSPFGKSDTASVLSEATAYIKFLHDQLQVLCAPYLRKAVTGKMQEGEDHYSLRSHGLCLVPLSSTFQIARSNGADLWAPVNTNIKP